MPKPKETPPEVLTDQTSDASGLPNPYDDFVGKPLFRLNVVVVTDDMLTIKSVCPSRGTIQHLVAGYVKSIADELRARNLNFYTPANLETFKSLVAQRLDWASRGHAAAGNVGKKSGGHDTGGKASVRSRAKNA